jgi:hypothetical protein
MDDLSSMMDDPSALADRSSRVMERPSCTEEDHMSAKKKASTKTKSAGVIAAPLQHAPLVEESTGVFTRKTAGRLLKPFAAQETSAPSVVKELHASSTYTEDLGADAPDRDDVADLVEAAAAWSNEAKNAKAWATYAQQQKELAWNAAIAMTNKLKGEFDHAVKNHPDVALSYPSLSAYFGARTASAARGSATKRAKKKQKPPPTS